jgi:hypothetical protein
MQGELIKRAAELMEDGTVNRVLGWQKGQFDYDITPAVFTSVDDLRKLRLQDSAEITFPSICAQSQRSRAKSLSF